MGNQLTNFFPLCYDEENAMMEFEVSRITREEESVRHRLRTDASAA